MRVGRTLSIVAVVALFAFVLSIKLNRSNAAILPAEESSVENGQAWSEKRRESSDFVVANVISPIDETEGIELERLVDNAIFGSVCAVNGKRVSNAVIELVSRTGHVVQSTMSADNGFFSFLPISGELTASSTPIIIRANSQGYVEETKSLWVDEVGYEVLNLSREMIFAMRPAKDLVLRWVFEEGTPVSNAPVRIYSNSGVHGWLDEGTPDIVRFTDQKGVVTIPGMPSDGIRSVAIEVEGITEWTRIPIDLGVVEQQRIKVPTSCALTVEIADSCKDPERKPASHVMAFVEGMAHKSGTQSSGYYKLQGNSCRIAGLRIGDKVELRIVQSRDQHYPVQKRVAIVDKNQFANIECDKLTAENAPALDGIRSPLRFKWSLVDQNRNPITLGDFGIRDVSSFDCLWIAADSSGKFSLSYASSNPRSELFGFCEIPAIGPIELIISGFGISQTAVLRRESQTVEITLDIEALNESLNSVRLMPKQEGVGIKAVLLIDQETGDQYEFRSARRVGDESIELTLPDGVYDYTAASANDEVCVGRFKSGRDKAKKVLLRFLAQGSIRGKLPRVNGVLEVLIVRQGDLGAGLFGEYSARPLQDGSFAFASVTEGEYSLAVRIVDGPNTTILPIAESFYIQSNQINQITILSFSSHLPRTQLIGVEGEPQILVDVYGDDKRLYRGMLGTATSLLIDSMSALSVRAIREEGSWLGYVDCRLAQKGSDFVFSVP